MNALLAEFASDGTRFCLAVNFLALCVITTAIFSLRFIIANPTEKELLNLHKKRMQAIREALGSPSDNDWNIPTETRYPFDGWVKLTGDGIVVAGELLNPNSKFEVTARDQRNVSRAFVASDGRGTVLIHSHGQSFRARLERGYWIVNQIKLPTHEP